MSNSSSTRGAPARPRTTTERADYEHRWMARAFPIGALLAACLLLAAAAAADGQAAALVLALWVVVLVGAGVWLTVPRAGRTTARPVLVLAELDEDGEIGEPLSLRLVATPAARRVVSGRPRG